MNKLSLLLVLAFIASLIGCGGGGGGNGGSVMTTLIVKTIDATNDKVLTGMSVSVTPPSGPNLSGQTDALGQWTYQDFPSGKSTINITDTSNKYQPFQMQVDIPSGYSSYTVTIRLNPTGLTIPDTISISPDNITLKVGEKKQFTAATNPVSTLKPTWSFFGTVGTISSSGLFTASSVGTGTVIVQIGTLKTTALVTVVSSTTPTKGTIAGTVKDGTLPIIGATVTLDGKVTTTSDTNGNYVFNDVTAGSHTIASSKTGYNSANGNATVATGATTTLNITLMPFFNTVKVGKDRTITDYNHHTYWFFVINGGATPSGANAQSEDDKASVSETPAAGYAEEAYARLGVDIVWDLNGKTWDQVKNTPCTVTVTCDYTLQANYTTNTGFANAHIKVEKLNASGEWYDQFGTVTSQTGTRTRTSEAMTFNTTLASIANQIYVVAKCDAGKSANAPAGTTNTCQAQVTVKSIKITF